MHAVIQKQRPAGFLDLNGTLVGPVQVERFEQLTPIPIPGALEAVARLNQAGFAYPVVTVQLRTTKGNFSKDAFHRWFAVLAKMALEKGAILPEPCVCPPRFADECHLLC